MTSVLVFLIWVINFLFQKIVGVCLLRSNIWVVYVFFGRRVWWHPMAKPALSSCLWKHHSVLFLLVLHVSSLFFFFLFSFFFSLFKKKYTFILFLCFDFSSYILFFIFAIGSFINFFYVFNLALKLQFIKYYFLQFNPYFFYFWFYFLALLLKFYWFSISSFNQSLCCFILKKIYPSFFWFLFSFVKVFVFLI